jgi:hypothetical protein
MGVPPVATAFRTAVRFIAAAATVELFDSDADAGVAAGAACATASDLVA